MKTKTFVLAALMAALLMMLASPAAFAAPDRLNFGAQLNAALCNPGGKLVINVVQRVINDADSAVGGTYWAMDDLSRQIQVWQTGDNTFCATVRYQGSWVTLGGPSPQNGTILNAGITGTMEGGYTAPITGTLKTNPAASTRGNIGTLDLRCDSNGNCLGAAFWADLYFDPGFSFDQPFWGWIYHGGSNGTWVNASTGNSGDITN